MAKLLLLSPDKKNTKPTKTIDGSGNKLKSYSAGYKFNVKEIEYTDFHKTIDNVLKDQSHFLILGQLTEYAIDQVDQKKSIRRIKKVKQNKDGSIDQPTIQDASDKVIVLDLDDILIKGWNPNKPTQFIKDWLKVNDINCNVTWQITSSQKLGSENARLRLYFECSKNSTLLKRKAYASTLGTDTCVFTCSQPIYTAPPIIIDDAKDFIKKRHGFIKGEYDQLMLPKFSEEKIRRLTTFEFSGFEYESTDLPPEVMNGEVHRRYFRGLALHYVNKIQEKDAVFYIIKGKIAQLPPDIQESRGNNDENIMEYIEGALLRVEYEREIEVAEEIVEEKNLSPAVLDDEILCPKNKFGELVTALYKLHWIPNLMVANVVARMTVAHGAAGIYRTEIGDRMNLQTIIIGESGCGKDLINFGSNLVFEECFDPDDSIHQARTQTIVQKVASMEGIQDLLFDNIPYEDCLMVFDEFGGVLDKAKTNMKLQDMFEDLMKAYTWSDILVPKRRKANSKHEPAGAITSLSAPHMNMLGATTKDLLVPALEYKFVGMGMLSRFMFFDADFYKGELREEKTNDIRISDDLKKNIQNMCDANQTVSGLQKLPSSRRYSPVIVTLSEGLKKDLHTFGLEDNRREGKLKQIWNRRTANAKKLAMVEAIIENPDEPNITHEIMDRCIKIATSCCNYAEQLFNDEVGFGDLDVARKQIIKKLERYKKGVWVKRGDALNCAKILKMKAFEKKQILDDLEADGIIETMLPDGKKGIVLRLMPGVK